MPYMYTNIQKHTCINVVVVVVIVVVVVVVVIVDESNDSM